MEIPWRLMDEVAMDLAGMASLGISDSICDHFWPVVAKSSQPVPQFWARLVCSAGAIMGFLEGFLSFTP